MTGTFGTPTVSVTGTITRWLPLPVSGIGQPHDFRPRRGLRQGATANWGAFTSIILVLDKTGPTTSGLALSPNPSSGARQRGFERNR